MIYEGVEPDDSIRQGDIFVRVPRFDLRLSSLIAISGRVGPKIAPWSAFEHLSEPTLIGVYARPVLAVVISQDCDATRSEDISFCEARPFADVEKLAINTKTPKAWKNILTTHARVNQKWFYLPPDSAFSIEERMAVDFRIPMRVPREDVETMRSSNRVGRLNEVAANHFRERIAEFFRRYPYDEWYPLNEEELAAYGNGAEPFPWQKT